MMKDYIKLSNVTNNNITMNYMIKLLKKTNIN